MSAKPKLPTVAGFYWLKGHHIGGEPDPYVVHVTIPGEDGTFKKGPCFWLPCLDYQAHCEDAINAGGEFVGPITPP